MDWTRGSIDGGMILEEVKDWEERTYYISGTSVYGFWRRTSIKNLGLPSNHIKTDFFPGFA